MKLTLQQNAHQGYQPVEIELPDDWEVEYLGMPGDDCPALTKEQIREKLDRPYGMKPLSELAKGRKEVCIVFDDISRGTPTQQMAEVVLEELHEAGIQKEQIRFICALGTHGAHNRNDFVEKLGEDIVKNYKVFNHNCFENNVCIGKTKKGVDVCINKEFMSCDLKIGLGAITPHIFNAYAGGGKMLFPGLASIETIHSNHKTAISYLVENKLDVSAMMGDLRMAGMREEIEEMTRMVGEFFKVDAIYNTKLELVDLFAGDPVEEYYAGVAVAQKLYATEKPVDRDIVIVNANAKANEAAIAVSLAAMGIKASGGDVVMVNHTKLGQVLHYLLGNCGSNAPGRMHASIPTVRPQLNRLICWMPYPEPGSKHWFGDEEKQIYVETWEEVLDLLKEKYGPGTKVSVLADGTIQYYKLK